MARDPHPPPSTPVAELLQQLGAGEATPGRFTLDREAARSKLSAFQLAEPLGYLLQLVRAAVLRGASRVDVSVGASAVEVRFDGAPLQAEDLDVLYASVFEEGSSALLRSRQELAIGILAALAHGHRQVTVESGTGSEAAQLVARRSGKDRVTRNPREEEGTRVCCRRQAGLGWITRLFQRRLGGLPEVALLRDRCARSDVPVTVNGKQVSSGLKLDEVLASVPLPERSGFQGVVGISRWPRAASRLELVAQGVTLATHDLSGVLPALFTGVQALVKADDLRQDLSRGDVIRDERYAAMLGELRGLPEALLLALVERQRVGIFSFEGSEELIQRLRGALAAFPGQSLLTAPPGTAAAALGRVPLFSTPRDGYYASHGVLTAVWAASPDDQFAVGHDGAVARLQGSQWIRQRRRTREQLLAVSGTSAGDVWAVGQAGTIVHFDGQAWTATRIRAAKALSAVWVGSPASVYALGDGEDVWHFDGQAWRHHVKLRGSVIGLCGDAASGEVFAYGYSGAIQRYAGGEWRPLPVVTSEPLRAACGVGPADVTFVGDQGACLHWDGETLTPRPTGTRLDLRAIAGTPPDHQVAVADTGELLRWDGRRWSLVGQTTATHCAGLATFGPDRIHVWESTAGSQVRWDGRHWVGMRLSLEALREHGRRAGGLTYVDLKNGYRTPDLLAAALGTLDDRLCLELTDPGDLPLLEAQLGTPLEDVTPRFLAALSSVRAP